MKIYHIRSSLELSKRSETELLLKWEQDYNLQDQADFEEKIACSYPAFIFSEVTEDHDIELIKFLKKTKYKVEQIHFHEAFYDTPGMYRVNQKLPPEEIPTRGIGVYILREWKTRRYLYIGKSVGLRGRITRHLFDHCFNSLQFNLPWALTHPYLRDLIREGDSKLLKNAMENLGIEVVAVITPADIRHALEMDLIKKFKPLYNKQKN